MAKTIMRELLRAPYEHILGTVIIFVIFCIMATAVVLRYGFGISIFWSEEFCRMALILLAFLGIPAGFHRNSHMYVDIMRWYGGFFSKVSVIAFVLSSALFMAILIYSIYSIGTQLTTTRSAALRIPMSWVYWMIGAATLFGFVRLGQLTLKHASKTP